ncbi:MAG TPA: aquaporin, partial [Actinomycetota bacterium]|nr:aquaporin [Actinomycetota bacterium]
IIGLALGGGILVTGPITGGSANFARSLGPFLASMVFDAKNVPWSDLIWYAIGPIVGASAAALVYESVTSLGRPAPAPDPGSATSDGVTPPGVQEAEIPPAGTATRDDSPYRPPTP